jgi:hypothetical protein
VATDSRLAGAHATLDRGLPNARLALAWLGLSLPLFAVLVAPLPIWQAQPSPKPGPGAAAEALGPTGAVASVGFILLLCLPYHPYRLALRAVREGISSRLLLVLTLLVAAIGVLTYPRFGSDVFDYAAYERTWVVYGDNPLVGIAANYPSDWTLPFVNVADRTPAYGPLWAILTWPAVRLAGDSAAAEVAGYKVLSVLAYAASCWLIWASVSCTRRAHALILFAWSPLVLFEALGKLHNDVLMALSLLGMFWLIDRRQSLSGMLAIVAGALVKATALVAAPPLVVRVWRHESKRALIPLCLGSAAFAGVAYAPFWAGLQTFSSIWQQTAGLGWSLMTVLTVLGWRLSGEQFLLVVRATLGLVWVGVCLLMLTRRRLKTAQDLAATTAWLLIATLVLMTGSVYGHYFVPLVALAAVADDPVLERIVLWLSVGGLLVYAVGALGWAFTPLWIGTLDYQVVGTLVLFGPAAIAGSLAFYSRSRPMANVRTAAT